MLEKELRQVTSEFRLLLACCQPHLEWNTPEDLLRGVKSEINWPEFLRLAERHQVTALAYRNLRRTAQEFIPEEALRTLKDRSSARRRSSLILAGELAKLSRLFTSAGVPVISLKGPALSLQLYDDLALRSFVDLDLLSRPEDIDTVEEVLSTAGYIRVAPDFPLSPRQRAYFMRIGRHYVYKRQQNPFTIELHWRLWPNPYLLPPDQTAQAFERCQTLDLAGNPVPILADEDNLAFLAIHGASHKWASLKWLCDLAMMISRMEDAQWQRLADIAIHSNIRRAMAQGLILANALLYLPLPASTQTASLADRSLHSLVQQAFSTLTADNLREPKGNLQRFYLTRYLWGLNDSFRYRLIALEDFWLDPSARDWKDIHLPDSLFPLYFILRPLLWFRRYHT